MRIIVLFIFSSNAFRGKIIIMRIPKSKRTVLMSTVILIILVLGVSNLMARPATRIDPLYVDAEKWMDETQRMVVSNESYFQPNSVCSSCHIEFFEDWAASYHAEAWRDTIFQAMYTKYQRYMMSDEYYIEEDEIIEMDTEGLNNREIRRLRWELSHNREAELSELVIPVFRIEDSETQISTMVHGDGLMREGIYDGKIHINCMRCHAPGADFMMDENLFLENSIDGIFCDYCHTIIDYTETEGYVLFWGGIKQGPRFFGTTSSHAIEYNRLYESSIFCMGCHQYENPLGFNVYNTYNEWFTSEYNNPATRVHCQECHMPPAPGHASLRSDWRPDVHSHAIGGGHDYDFMLESASVDFTTDIQGDELYIDVDVTNSQAGHNYPTSNGMRQLVLIVRLKGSENETLWEGSRIYERVLGDEAGNPTLENYRAAQVLYDTTLLPGEVRTESFVAVMPDTDDTLYITAQLFYRLTPEQNDIQTIYQQEPFRIDFATEFIQ